MSHARHASPTTRMGQSKNPGATKKGGQQGEQGHRCETQHPPRGRSIRVRHDVAGSGLHRESEQDDDRRDRNVEEAQHLRDALGAQQTSDNRERG
jgi:hypothetical protein